MQNPEELIRKLLAMAKGGTEHEAALAAEKAAEIALKHNIDLLDLQQSTDTKPEVGQDSVYNSPKREVWICNILYGITLLNSCKFYTATQGDGSIKYRVVGRKVNIITVEATAEYLVQTIKRLNREAVKQYDFDQNQRQNYRKDFRLAASRRLCQRMEELYAQRKTQTGKALIVISNMLAEVDEFMEDLELKDARQVSTKLRSLEGIRDGERAGQSISLNQQMGDSNHGVRRIA